jgi:hypothetical protein
MISFMHIFSTNKVPRVVLWFSYTGTHLGEFGINTPLVPGTAQQPGLASLARRADPALLHDSGPEHPHSLEHNLDERDSLKKC